MQKRDFFAIVQHAMNISTSVFRISPGTLSYEFKDAIRTSNFE